MKVLIDDNSVCIRLTSSELDQFSNEGYIEHTISFVSGTLIYALESISDSLCHELSADLQNNVITVYVPKSIIDELTNTSITVFNNYVDVDFGERIFLKIEKDFEYEDDSNDNQSDKFNNNIAVHSN